MAADAGLLKGLKREVVRRVGDIAPALGELSLRIHANPEPGYGERQACAWLCQALEERGFEVLRAPGGLETAFCARRGAGHPVVAFLAEYDALPEVGHGCGHNLIGAASIGAATALAGLLDRLSGTVMVIGTPAEEGAVDDAGGKAVLLERGVFAGVDAAMMFHPSTHTSVATTTTAREALEISFRGRAAHAAGSPAEGINALDAVILLFNSINALRPALREGSSIHGVITHGGVVPNIIPEHAAARVYVRAPTHSDLAEASRRVRDCAQGAALATGATPAIRTYARTYLSMAPNRVLAALFSANLALLRVRAENVPRGAGSTDMGNVSQVLPALHPYIAIPGLRAVPSHSRPFADAAGSARGLRTMLLAARLLALTGADLLGDPDLVAQAWAAHANPRAIAKKDSMEGIRVRTS